MTHHLAQGLGGRACAPLAGDVLMDPGNVLVLLRFRGQHRLAVLVSVSSWKYRESGVACCGHKLLMLIKK
jgi:hypothetical protein